MKIEIEKFGKDKIIDSKTFIGFCGEIFGEGAESHNVEGFVKKRLDETDKAFEKVFGGSLTKPKPEKIGDKPFVPIKVKPQPKPKTFLGKVVQKLCGVRDAVGKVNTQVTPYVNRLNSAMNKTFAGAEVEKKKPEPKKEEKKEEAKKAENKEANK